MTTFEFSIRDWVGNGTSDSPTEQTISELSIQAGQDNDLTRLTEVFDSIARTVRDHVCVSAYPLAQWLLVNWWRLRWEGERRSADWLFAHSMSSIGEGYVWPPLSIASDGEFIQLRQQAEPRRDIAAIRYMGETTLEIPAAVFEKAVDGFINAVIERLGACGQNDQELAEVYEELRDERDNNRTVFEYSLQARAGYYPGEAPAGWEAEIEELGKQLGTNSVGEFAAALPYFSAGLMEARQSLDAIKSVGSVVDLSWLPSLDRSNTVEIPWQKGARLAAQLRQSMGINSGPISNNQLSDWFQIQFPLVAIPAGTMLGGLREDDCRTKAKMSVKSSRAENQRFQLARLAASALLTDANETYIPVTNAYTAMQKAERAFAQELLCPWAELDAFTDDRGLDPDSISDTAEHFGVSELAVMSTLVNKGKVDRSRLNQFAS